MYNFKTMIMTEILVFNRTLYHILTVLHYNSYKTRLTLEFNNFALPFFCAHYTEGGFLENAQMILTKKRDKADRQKDQTKAALK